MADERSAPIQPVAVLHTIRTNFAAPTVKVQKARRKLVANVGTRPAAEMQ